MTSDLNKVFIYVKACSLHDSSDLCDSLQCSNSDVQDSPHSLLQPRPVGILFWACGTLHSPSHRKSRTWSSEVYFKILYFGFSRCTSNFLHTPGNVTLQRSDVVWIIVIFRRNNKAIMGEARTLQELTFSFLVMIGTTHTGR